MKLVFVLCCILAAKVSSGAKQDNGCRRVQCYEGCDSGYRINSFGCQTCNCINPCEEFGCPRNKKCRIKVVECIKDPCYPVRECIAACPLLKCLPCSTGFKRDKDGCPTCECITPKTTPCMIMRCAKGFKCIEVVDPCLIPPCPVRGECVPSTTA